MAENDTKKKPWTKWYFKDWRADKALRACSLQARGLWMEMLAIMDEADPYGHLVINGHPVDAEELVNQAGGGVSLKEVKALLEKMKRAGVYRITDDGVIYSKRMVEDEGKRRTDIENGKLGGNPKLKDAVKPPDKAGGSLGGKPQDQSTPLTPPLKAQRPEARGQKPEKQPDPGEVEAPARPPTAQPSSETTALLRQIIEELGLDEQRVMHAGPVLSWLKDGATADEIMTVCKRLKPRLPANLRDPLAYINKAFPEALAALRKDEQREAPSEAYQELMCRVYYAVGTPGSEGKPVPPWTPRPVDKRNWPPYFPGTPPFKPGTVIKDAVAIAVLGELGLDIQTEIEWART